MQNAISLPNGMDMDVIELQNDTELQSRAKESNFWELVSREKFLSSCALKSSKYFCETALLQMEIIKAKHWTPLTDRPLSDCLRLGVSNYEPNYRALTDTVQSQSSDWF